MDEVRSLIKRPLSIKRLIQTMAERQNRCWRPTGWCHRNSNGNLPCRAKLIPTYFELETLPQRYPLFCFQYFLCSSHGTCDWPALEFKLLDLDYLSLSWLFPTLEYDFIKIAGFSINIQLPRIVIVLMLFKKARTIRLMDWGQIFERWSSSKQKG